MAVDLSVFGRQKSIVDQQQLQQAFELKKAAAISALQKQAQGDALPAPLQLANEYQRRVDTGDINGANTLMQFAKTQDRGLSVDANGNYVPLAGYGQSVGSIAAEKKGMEQNAKNQSDLGYAGGIAAAKATGTEVGKAQANVDKMAITAPQTNDTIDEVIKLLPQATSGKLETTGKAINQYFGKSTPASQADTQLNILAAKLTGSVPRFEGPQGVLDVELYKQAAGDVANTLLPTADRAAAANLIKQLNNKYLVAPTQPSDNNTLSPAEQAELEQLRQELGAQ